jgi:hypothetical protein
VGSRFRLCWNSVQRRCNSEGITRLIVEAEAGRNTEAYHTQQ